MRILITGAAGQLGRDLVDAFAGKTPIGGLTRDERTGWLGARRPSQVIGCSRADLDVCDREAVLEAFDQLRPDVVVNCAAFTAVDLCEEQQDQAWAVNALAVRNLAEACGTVGSHLCQISTDYVFGGESETSYREWDQPDPASEYGRSKLAGETEAQVLGIDASIIRLSWVAGFHGTNMVKTVLRLAEKPGALRFVDDQVGSPTFTADAAGVIALLATQRRPGVFHLTNSGSTSWYGLAQAVLQSAGYDPERVEPIATDDLDPPRPAPRPANSILDNSVLRMSGFPPMPSWTEGLERLVQAICYYEQPALRA